MFPARIMNKAQSLTSLVRFIKTKITILLLLLFVMFSLHSNFRVKLPQLRSLISHTPEERYLAYLPHSGLSNQRIELSNALLLAYMLNRTLLIPPAFLGTVVGWLPRKQLDERLEWLTTPKPFTKLCQRPVSGRLLTYVQKSRCDEYRHSGVLPWLELHDLTQLQPDIRYRSQNIMSLVTIQKDLNLSDDDIYIHQDAQLYDWQLYENQKVAKETLHERANYVDSFGGRRYYKVLVPQHFDKKEKLLFLGGVFGSTRLNVVDPDLKAMQERIKLALHYRLDTPIGATVKSIVEYMGGKGSFMSLHFRTGDKPFINEISVNLKIFMKNMTDLVGTQESGQCTGVTQDITDVGKRVNVYIATDQRNPKGEDSAILPWFHEFPCTTTLDDVPADLFAPLDDLRDMVSPSKSLKTFLIPLIDAMVAAHGRNILTTPRSTFSKYTDELHQAWVP